MTNLITELFKNPLAIDFNNELFSKDAIPKIKALTVSNNSLLKIFGQVYTVMPLENIGISNQSKYLIKYKIGARVALVTKNNLGQIISIVSEAE